MATLKRKLAKIDEVPEALRSFYKADGDAFVLDTDSTEPADRETLERSLANARKDAKEAKDRLAALESAANAASEEALRAKGDLPALETSYKKKLADQERELKAQIAERDKQLSKVFVDNAAETLAKSISEKPSVLLPHILPRLRVEVVDGEPLTRVLDKAGKPTALGLADLAKEFVDNADFAGIVTASRASGGGAQGGKGGGGAASDASFKNADGSINWTAVAAAAEKDPAVLDRFSK